ncbi:MAG TPA: nucleoside triphosphate pyrophosphohydrolase [Firmicutes bacterium]|jgi:tetrapyrrole methylase family protein/MazG family protein|nr:nucleoside triphosphate pyrophosphohydrolase [Bacillota bacterium]
MNSGEELEKLERIMERLRGEDGCPWDRKQTHASLRPCLIEEAYEVLEAIEKESAAALREELGDLLLQVVFHAQIARENGDFSLAEVITGINEKLIRRHPHVFGDAQVDGVEGVLKNWEQIKAEEKKEASASALDSIPTHFPALLRAGKMQEKASRLGFDWPDMKGPLAKISEESKEFHRAWNAWRKARSKEEKEEKRREMEEEFGDILFALVNLSRFLGIDPETALHRVTGKFYRRFRAMEEAAAKQGLDIRKMTLAEMDRLWEAEKTAEQQGPPEYKPTEEG